MTISTTDKRAFAGARQTAAAKYLSFGLAGGLALLALATLVASFLPAKTVVQIVIGSSADDQVRRGADTLVSAFHDLMMRLRLCSAGLGLAAILAAVWTRRIQTWIDEAVLPMPSFLRSAARSVAGGLKADGGLNIVVLLTLTVIGVMFRILFLFRPMRYDEADSFITFASRPLYVGLSWYPEPNNHLLHTLLMHVSWRLFGEHEWALRMPALFFGTLLILVTYWAARVLYDKNSAMIAAAMVAASSPLVSYSVEGRGYTMICVLFLLQIITTHYLLKHDSGPAWLLWALLAALSLYTVPTMLYGVSTAALWLAFSSGGMEPERSRRQCLNRLTAALFLAGGMTVLLYAPVLMGSGWRSLVANPHVRPRTLGYVFANFPLNVSQTWTFWTTDVPLPLALLLTAGFLIALWRRKTDTGQSVPIPLAAALSIVPLLLIQRVVPYARVWIFLLPLCAAISAAGLWLLIGRVYSSRLAGAAALGLFVLMGVFDLRGTSLTSAPLDAIQDCVVWIKGNLKQGDAVLALGGIRAPLNYYFRRHNMPLISRPAQCDPLAVVTYTAKGAPVRNPAGAAMRVLIMTAGQRESLQSFAACTTGFAPPKSVFERPEIRIFESATGPSGWPSSAR